MPWGLAYERQDGSRSFRDTAARTGRSEGAGGCPRHAEGMASGHTTPKRHRWRREKLRHIRNDLQEGAAYSPAGKCRCKQPRYDDGPRALSSEAASSATTRVSGTRSSRTPNAAAIAWRFARRSAGRRPAATSASTSASRTSTVMHRSPNRCRSRASRTRCAAEDRPACATRAGTSFIGAIPRRNAQQHGCTARPNRRACNAQRQPVRRASCYALRRAPDCFPGCGSAAAASIVMVSTGRTGSTGLPSAPRVCCRSTNIPRCRATISVARI